jgi:hypothetical protein
MNTLFSFVFSFVAFWSPVFLRATKTDSAPPRRCRLGTQSRDPCLSSGASAETHHYVCNLRIYGSFARLSEPSL